MKPAPFRLLVVALNAYPAIEPQTGSAIGGLETFAWSFASRLATNSRWQVQFALRHHSPPVRSVVNGVSILPIVERLRPIRQAVSRDVEVLPHPPWLRFRRIQPALFWQLPLLAVARLAGHPRPLTHLMTELVRHAQPDGILTLGVGDGTAAAVDVARHLGIRSWLWVRSNADLNASFISDDRYQDPYGVNSLEARRCYAADGILCQTRWQQGQVRELLGRDSFLIPNPVDSQQFPIGESTARNEVLWVGRYDEHHKRPRIALEVARLCPNIPFRFIINRGNPDTERAIRSDCPSNVQLLDYISRDTMPAQYRRSRLFLSTGSNQYEGFPNVLLEAASSGTPIVSLEEFDGFLEESRAGVVNDSVTGLADQVRRLWTMPEDWHTHSMAGSTWVRRERTLEQCINRFETAVSSD